MHPLTAPTDTRPETVTLADALDAAHAALTRHVVFPCPEAADAVTLWAATTHLTPVLPTAPRLMINSPERGCGKSTLMDLVKALSRNPESIIDATAGTAVRLLSELVVPTLFFDEADIMFKNDGSGKGHAELRAVLNSGFEPGGYVMRCARGSNGGVLKFPTFGPVCVAGIGNFPDTLTSRSVVITMRRKALTEEVTQYRPTRHAVRIWPIREAISNALDPLWADFEARCDWLGADVPEGEEPRIPASNREADVWEPLIAVADLAGGEWVERARRACVELVRLKSNQEPTETTGVQLLEDIRSIFELKRAEIMPTEDLMAALSSVQHSPWNHGRYTPAWLANRLSLYGIEPDRLPRRRGERQRRGYRKRDFVEAWGRFLPVEEDES